MIVRIEGQASGVENIFGVSPRYADINWSGLPFSPAQFDTVTHIDQEAWTQELALHQTLSQQPAHHLPPALEATRTRIGERLAAA